MYTPSYDAERNALYFVADPHENRDRFAGRINVFVCGGLQNPDKMAAVLGRAAAFAPAMARGFRHDRVNVNGRDMPFMLPAEPTAALTGVVWLDLSADELAKIEAIELADNLRRRIDLAVHLGHSTLAAISYVKMD